MKTSNVSLLSATDVSSSVNSSSVPVGYFCRMSVQAIITGTASGTLVIQGSNDAPGTASPTFTTIANTSATVNSANPYIKQLDVATYEFVRIAYTASSGTGTMTARLKTFGDQ